MIKFINNFVDEVCFGYFHFPNFWCIIDFLEVLGLESLVIIDN